MDGYKFETFLPYPLRVPLNSAFHLAYEGLEAEFTHLDRVQPPRASKAVLSPTHFVPADRYGLFFRSKVSITLSPAATALLLSKESAELQRIFKTTDEYVSQLFGNPGALLSGRLVVILNHVLSLYRVLYEDWHACPLAPVDLPSWRIVKIDSGVERFLTLCDLGHQMLQPLPNAPGQLEEVFANVLVHGGSIAPLQSLEADIHDRISHGDLVVALVLMGLLVEEALRDHLVLYLHLGEHLSYEDAEARLERGEGHSYGVADFVDPPKGRRGPPLMETIAGWRSFEYPEYAAWNLNLREIRNGIIHRGRKHVTAGEAEAAWSSAVALITLSFKKVVEKLLRAGVDVEQQQARNFAGVLSTVAGTQGLFGSHNQV